MTSSKFTIFGKRAIRHEFYTFDNNCGTYSIEGGGGSIMGLVNDSCTSMVPFGSGFNIEGNWV